MNHRIFALKSQYNKNYSARFILTGMMSLVLLLAGFSSCDKRRKPAKMAATDIEILDNFIKTGDSLLHSNPRGAIRVGLQMIHKSETIGDWNKIGKALHLIAAAYFALEKPDSSLHYLYQAIALKNNINDQLLWAKILIEFGKTYRLLNNTDSTVFYFDLAAKLADQLNETKLKMAASNNLANVLSDIGNKGEAYNQYFESLRYAEQLQDNRNKAVLLNNLALIDAEMRNFTLAEQRYREAISINAANNRYFDLAMNYGNLAIVFENTNRDDSAIVYNNKTIALAREKGFIRDLARALVNGSMSYGKKGNFQKAREYLLEADELCRKHGIVFGLFYTNTGLYKIERELANYPAAIEYLNRANEVVNQLDDNSLKSELLHMFAESYYASAQYKKAYDYLIAHQKLSDSLRQIANTNLVAELQTRYETEKKELENKQLRIDNQSQLQRVRLLNITSITIGVAFIVTLMLIFLQLRNRRQLKKYNTQLSSLNSEVTQKNKELLIANQTKDKLFSVIAHDLKSPFNALMGLLELLIKDGHDLSEEEKKDFLNKLYNQTNYTYGTLENLLQWAMSKRNLITANRQEMLLLDAVNVELEFLSGRSGEKGIILENKVNPEIKIYSDPQLVSNIVRNLVNNSIKFSNPGKKVSIEDCVIDGKIALLIRDEGVGMSNEKIEQLFNEEFTESEKGTQNEKGTGLGFQMVREFARIIDAKLRVESSKGQGTSVWVIFPDQAV